MYPAPRFTSAPPTHDRATKSTHPFSGALLGDGVAVLDAVALPLLEADALRERVRDALGVSVTLADSEALRVGLRVLDGDCEAEAVTLCVRVALASTDRVSESDAVTDRESELETVNDGHREPDTVADHVRELDSVTDRVCEAETVADGQREPETVALPLTLRETVALPLTLRETDGDAENDRDSDAVADTLCDCARGGASASSSSATSTRSIVTGSTERSFRRGGRGRKDVMHAAKGEENGSAPRRRRRQRRRRRRRLRCTACTSRVPLCPPPTRHAHTVVRAGR